eukprot:2940753-Ditylum_brightwellii.AAC.1
MDTIRIFQLNGALLNNNAVACYDCMVPGLTSLQLQSLGLQAPAVKCSVKLNYDMRHHIKTNAGISTELYGHMECFPKYGEGHGKVSSPSNWLFTICTLLSALHGLHKGINLWSVGKRFKSQRFADTYVDDTDGATIDQNTQKSDTPPKIRDKLQTIAQTWANLLFRLGGELLKEKTS